MINFLIAATSICLVLALSENATAQADKKLPELKDVINASPGEQVAPAEAPAGTTPTEALPEESPAKPTEGPMEFTDDGDIVGEEQSSEEAPSAAPATGNQGPVGIPQVEATPVVLPTDEPAATTPTKTPDGSTRKIIEDRRKRREEAKDQRMFGSYRLHIGAVRPTFETQSKYEEHYSASSWMPTLGVDYFAFDWYATLGLAFRFGYYKDSGYALKTENGESVKDKSTKTELTLVPLQVAAAAEISPFSQKWIVLSGWAGYEYLYFQEVRKGEDSATPAATDSEEETSSGLFTTSGWRQGTVLGAAASFRIDWADGQASGSLSTISMRDMYLTPFIEVVTSSDNERLNFERKSIGLLFTIESMN
jgi:hypothetical protein